MDEYITKEAASEVFEWGDADVIEDYGDGCDFGFSRGAIKSAINTIPAADVAPVVRCKDCKHLAAVNVNGKGIPTCRMSGMEVAPDEFCSRGEKGRR